MSLEAQFYIQIAGCFLAAGGIFWLMQKHENKKQAERERQFQLTLAAIEARNKIHPIYQKKD